jgi:hypothetical protein
MSTGGVPVIVVFEQEHNIAEANTRQMKILFLILLKTKAIMTTGIITAM